jgi:hypothetical protein
MDGMDNCGDSTEREIRQNFFQIIEMIARKVKVARTYYKNYIHLINGLAWGYRAKDLENLAKLRVFELLKNGDGTSDHPFRNARPLLQ